MVKDLDYSENAYLRAKEKLEKKYGGEHRTQLKHLNTQRGANVTAWVSGRHGRILSHFISNTTVVALQDHGPGGELIHWSMPKCHCKREATRRMTYKLTNSGCWTKTKNIILRPWYSGWR